MTGRRRSPGATTTHERAYRASGAPSRRFRRAGALVAAAALGALAVPGGASAVVLPPAPAGGVHMPPVDRAITVFPVRDFVSADGYAKNELVTVEVFRNGVLIGRSPDIVPTDDPKTSAFDGLVEVNHVGAACWGGAGSPNVTPDVLEGDVVRITATTNEDDPSARTVTTVDQTVTANVKADKATSPAPGTVVVHGSAQDDAGNRIPIDQLELRMISGSANRFTINGRRDIRAISGADGEGKLSYDADGSTNWTATFMLSDADVTRAVSSDIAAAWLGAAPGAGVEGTIYEPLEIPGPGAPECPALARNGVTNIAPQSLNLAFVKGSSDLTLSGVAQADTSAVSVRLTDSAGAAVTASADLSAGAGAKTWTATIPRGDIAATLGDGTLTASAIYTVAASNPDPTAAETADITGTTLSIAKDTAAPTATPLATPGPGLYNKDQSVVLTADAGETIHYTTDGKTATAASRAYTAPIAVTASQTISALAVDKAGNEGPAMSYAYDIDKVAPTTTDNVSNKPVAPNTPVRLTSTDDNSGVNVTYYTTNGQDPAALAPAARAAYDPAQPPVLANGERIRYFSVDKAGNAEATKTSLVAANVDSAAPASKDNVGADFSATAVQATLSADDGPAGSGVETIRYAINADPAGPEGRVYTGPVTLSNGQSVWYYAEDAVGNVERPFHKSAAAKVDTTAPTTTDNVNALTVYAADVTVNLAADDGTGSGVAKTWWTTDNSNPANPLNPNRHELATSRPVLGNGQSVKYYSIDNVGNTEGVKTSATAHVDAVAPTTTDDVPATIGRTDVTVTLTAADNAGGSGVAATWYTLDGTDPTQPGGTRQQYTDVAKPVLVDGQRIRYASVDKVGRWEAPVLSRAARVDATAPQTTDNVPSAVQPRAVTVTLSATDKSDSGAAGSGVAATWYTLDGSDPTKATNAARVKYDPAAKPVLDDGQRITYASVDALGNTEIVSQSAIVTVRVPAQTQSTDVAAGSTAATTTPAAPSAPAPATTALAAPVPATPAPAAAVPALRPTSVRLASSFGARTVRRSGVRVTVKVPAAAKVVEIQVLQLGAAEAARTAAAGRNVLATIRRPASGTNGTTIIRLNSPALRRKLKPGTYELRIRVGRSKSTLGAATTKRFRIR